MHLKEKERSGVNDGCTAALEAVVLESCDGYRQNRERKRKETKSQYWGTVKRGCGTAQYVFRARVVGGRGNENYI